MIKTLVDKFNPLDDGAIQAIMSSMQNLQLLDSEDLSTYKDKLENLNFNSLGLARVCMNLIWFIWRNINCENLDMARASRHFRFHIQFIVLEI
jgi:hypothetical protein